MKGEVERPSGGHCYKNRMLKTNRAKTQKVTCKQKQKGSRKFNLTGTSLPFSLQSAHTDLHNSDWHITICWLHYRKALSCLISLI